MSVERFNRDVVLFWVFLVFVFVVLGGWITHIAHCITENMWFELITGIIVFPAGVLHGIVLWFI